MLSKSAGVMFARLGGKQETHTISMNVNANLSGSGDFIGYHRATEAELKPYTDRCRDCALFREARTKALAVYARVEYLVGVISRCFALAF